MGPPPRNPRPPVNDPPGLGNQEIVGKHLFAACRPIGSAACRGLVRPRSVITPPSIRREIGDATSAGPPAASKQSRRPNGSPTGGRPVAGRSRVRFMSCTDGEGRRHPRLVSQRLERLGGRSGGFEGGREISPHTMLVHGGERGLRSLTMIPRFGDRLRRVASGAVHGAVGALVCQSRSLVSGFRMRCTTICGW